jgi:hypothetical protein
VRHPCPFPAPVLAALAPLLSALAAPVHDPFAGTGLRLGALCDRLGLEFTGTEIEPEFIVDPRVLEGDSTDPHTYPPPPYVIATSPVYPNGMTDHFQARDESRRHTYRQYLAAITGEDRPLHPHNMGRWGNRFRRSARSEATHFAIARRCVRHWPDRALVNVKDVVAASYHVPVVEIWASLLREAGYRIQAEHEVRTPGQRDGANGDLRAEHEAILVAVRKR